MAIYPLPVQAGQPWTADSKPGSGHSGGSTDELRISQDGAAGYGGAGQVQGVVIMGAALTMRGQLELFRWVAHCFCINMSSFSQAVEIRATQIAASTCALSPNQTKTSADCYLLVLLHLAKSRADCACCAAQCEARRNLSPGHGAVRHPQPTPWCILLVNSQFSPSASSPKG